jgi:hypothetical protein
VQVFGKTLPARTTQPEVQEAQEQAGQVREKEDIAREKKHCEKFASIKETQTF